MTSLDDEPTGWALAAQEGDPVAAAAFIRATQAEVWRFVAALVDPGSADHVLAILSEHGRVAQVIGAAVSDAQKIVRLPAHSLAGQHKRFWRDDAGKRRAG